VPTRIISGWKEIPTTDDGTAVPVIQDPSGLPWVVEVEGISIINFNKIGSITGIAPSTKTTIVSQVFSGGVFENISIVSVSGTNYAKFFLAINGTDVDIRRTGPNLNLVFDYTGSPFALTSGDVVDIKVEHFNAGTEDFDATIYGYD
jgi:hypothetical protein